MLEMMNNDPFMSEMMNIDPFMLEMVLRWIDNPFMLEMIFRWYKSPNTVIAICWINSSLNYMYCHISVKEELPFHEKRMTLFNLFVDTFHTSSGSGGFSPRSIVKLFIGGICVYSRESSWITGRLKSHHEKIPLSYNPNNAPHSPFKHQKMWQSWNLFQTLVLKFRKLTKIFQEVCRMDVVQGSIKVISLITFFFH